MRLLLIGLAATLAVVPTPSAWVEAVYSRQAYLVSQNLLTPISSLTSIALFDVVFAAAVVRIALVVGARPAARGTRRSMAGGRADESQHHCPGGRSISDLPAGLGTQLPA